MTQMSHNDLSPQNIWSHASESQNSCAIKRAVYPSPLGFSTWTSQAKAHLSCHSCAWLLLERRYPSKRVGPDMGTAEAGMNIPFTF